ncbi:MAG: hypothetical protein QM793_05305 [Muricomes sp.]
MKERGEVCMDSVVKILQDYLNDVVYDPEHAFLDLEKLPEGFQELGKRLIHFSDCVIEATAFAKAMAKGNLDFPVPSDDNEIAAPPQSAPCRSQASYLADPAGSQGGLSAACRFYGRVFQGI